jgi:hypothetical protein
MIRVPLLVDVNRSKALRPIKSNMSAGGLGVTSLTAAIYCSHSGELEASLVSVEFTFGNPSLVLQKAKNLGSKWNTAVFDDDHSDENTFRLFVALFVSEELTVQGSASDAQMGLTCIHQRRAWSIAHVCSVRLLLSGPSSAS